MWCFVQGLQCSLPWLVLGSEICDVFMAGLNVMVIANEQKAGQLLAELSSYLGVQNLGFFCVFSFVIPREKSHGGASPVLLFFAEGPKQVSGRGS